MNWDQIEGNWVKAKGKLRQQWGKLTDDDIMRMNEAGIIGEDEKFELIEGEIVMMASKGIAHERIKSALNVAVVRALPDHLTVGVETTLRLTNTIMLEPDIAVFPKKL